MLSVIMPYYNLLAERSVIMISVLCGILCGFMQFILLRKLTSFLLNGKTKAVLLITAAKLALYAAVLTVLLLFFPDQVILFITGLAGALILGAIIQYFQSRR